MGDFFLAVPSGVVKRQVMARLSDLYVLRTIEQVLGRDPQWGTIVFCAYTETRMLSGMCASFAIKAYKHDYVLELDVLHDL